MATPPPQSLRSQSLRAEQVEATRLAILASARRLFGVNGYNATSIDDIARDARVTKGAVYHHFENKHELFRCVYAEVEADAQARTSGAARPRSSTIDQLVQGMHAYLDATLDPEVQRITLIDAPAVLGLEPDGPPDEQAGHRGVRDFVAAGHEGGRAHEAGRRFPRPRPAGLDLAGCDGDRPLAQPGGRTPPRRCGPRGDDSWPRTPRLDGREGTPPGVDEELGRTTRAGDV